MTPRTSHSIRDLMFWGEGVGFVFDPIYSVVLVFLFMSTKTGTGGGTVHGRGNIFILTGVCKILFHN